MRLEVAELLEADHAVLVDNHHLRCATRLVADHCFRHPALTAVAIDAEPYLDKIFELGQLYYDALQFPHRDWLEERLKIIGSRWGLKYAEEFDAWETPGGIVDALLPVRIDGAPDHPERTREDTL